MLLPTGQLAQRKLCDFFVDPGKPIQLDLGTGLGHFVCDMATAHQDYNWLGLEYEYTVAQRAAKRVANTKLTNALIVAIDARLLLLEHVAPQQLQHVWINFPDPWPKDRHQERRHTHPWMVGLIANRLALGGQLHFASDILEYHRELSEILATTSLLQPAPDNGWTRARLPIQTKYERKWLAAGKPLHFGDWQKNSAAMTNTQYQVEKTTPPQWQITAETPSERTLIEGDYLLKIFRARQPGRWRFLFVDRQTGVETHGNVNTAQQTLEINGVWTAWKIALLKQVVPLASSNGATSS